jgi:hypothetical protein
MDRFVNFLHNEVIAILTRVSLLYYFKTLEVAMCPDTPYLGYDTPTKGRVLPIIELNSRLY